MIINLRLTSAMSSVKHKFYKYFDIHIYPHFWDGGESEQLRQDVVKSEVLQFESGLQRLRVMY